MCFPALLYYPFLIFNALLLGIEEVFHPKSLQNFLPMLLPEVLQTSYLICTGKKFKGKVSWPGYSPARLLYVFLLNAIFLLSVLLFSTYLSIGRKMAPAKPSGANHCFKVEFSQFSMYHESSFKVVEAIYVEFLTCCWGKVNLAENEHYKVGSEKHR